jgi:hypothetical protein
MSLIEKFFSDERDNNLDSLLKDKKSKQLILKEVSKELPDHGGIIINYPNDQIIAIALEPDFADMDEGFYVGNIIIKYMTQRVISSGRLSEEQKTANSILPSLVYQDGKELAEKSLICLSFFQGYMEKRNQRYGAPSPKTYKSVAQNIFAHEGWESLSENFDNWQEFLQDQFNLVNINFDSNTYLDF